MTKPNLAAALKQHDTKAAATLPAPAEPAAPKPFAVQPGRVGKKQVMGYFAGEAKKQLKQLGVDLEKTEQDLLAEALNLLFAKYGKPTIA
jgi:hypothetical protein